MLEGLMLGKPSKKVAEVVVKKKFDFGTTKRAFGNVKVIPWLEGKSADEVADLWKLGHTAKKLTENEQQKFKDIKYYLKSKFGLRSIK